MSLFKSGAVAERDTVALRDDPEVQAAREQESHARQAHTAAVALYQELNNAANRTGMINTPSIPRDVFLKARRDLPAAQATMLETELAADAALTALGPIIEAARTRILAARLPGRRAYIAEIDAALVRVQAANLALVAFDTETAGMVGQSVPFVGFAYCMPETSQQAGVVEAWQRAMRTENLLD